MDVYKPTFSFGFVFQKSPYTGDGKAYTDHFMDKFVENHRKKHGKFGKIDQYPGHPTERIVLSDPVLCYKVSREKSS